MAFENRRFERTSQPFDVRYRPGGLVSTWTQALLLDLSAVGLRMQVEEILDLDMKTDIEIKLPHDPEHLLIEGIVVWSRAGDSGDFEVGIEFRALTTSQEAMIDELVQFLKESDDTV